MDWNTVQQRIYVWLETVRLHCEQATNTQLLAYGLLALLLFNWLLLFTAQRRLHRVATKLLANSQAPRAAIDKGYAEFADSLARDLTERIITTTALSRDAVRSALAGALSEFKEFSQEMMQRLAVTQSQAIDKISTLQANAFAAMSTQHEASMKVVSRALDALDANNNNDDDEE